MGDSFTGLGIAQLAFGALGVLAISSEYATGLIRTTFASVPRRRAVIAAKAAVVGVVSLLAGELIAFATFFTGQQALSAQHLNVALAHPGALRGVLAAGFYLAVMAWVGLGLGTVIRHTAGAITAVTGVVFLLPTIVGALPAPWNTDIGRYTLNLAAQQTIAQHPHPGYFPRPVAPHRRRVRRRSDRSGSVHYYSTGRLTRGQKKPCPYPVRPPAAPSQGAAGHVGQASSGLGWCCTCGRCWVRTNVG